MMSMVLCSWWCVLGVSIEIGFWLFGSLCSVCGVSGDVVEAQRCYCG